MGGPESEYSVCPRPLLRPEQDRDGMGQGWDRDGTGTGQDRDGTGRGARQFHDQIETSYYS